MSYKTVIFDLGRVIFNYSWEPMYAYFAELSGLSPQEVKDLIAVNKDPMFQDFERGLLPTPDYIKYVEALLDVPITISQFAEGFNSIYEEAYDGIKEILGELELKYLLVALTNTNPVHTAEWKQRYADEIIYFSYIFCSHEMHSRKPEPMIYEQLLRSTGNRPEECIFFDDRADNVEGARAVGITAVQVASPAEIRDAIRDLGL